MCSTVRLLAQLRQPGRSVFSDLEPTTFQKFQKQLLGKQDFNLHQKIQGTLLSPPSLEHCMSCEYEIKKEAHKQCRETNIGINAARWNACNNQQHRMMHGLQLVSLVNSGHRARRQNSQKSRGSSQTCATRVASVPARLCPTAKAKVRQHQQLGPSQIDRSFPFQQLRQKEDPRGMRQAAKRKAPKEKALAFVENARHMTRLGHRKLSKERLRLGKTTFPNLAGQDDQPGFSMFSRQLRVCSLPLSRAAPSSLAHRTCGVPSCHTLETRIVPATTWNKQTIRDDLEASGINVVHGPSRLS